MKIDERMQLELRLPSTGPSDEEGFVYGGNPGLWARLVKEVKAYIDHKGRDCLEWMQRRNEVLVDFKLESDWVRRGIVRNL